MSYLFPAVLLVAVHAISGRRRHLIFGLTLVIPAIAIHGTAILVPGAAPLSIARGVLILAFLLYVTGLVIQRVFTGTRVTADTINGSICGYLLIGVTWAVLLGLVEALVPGSFDIPGLAPGILAEGAQAGPLVPHLLYFSFVTLTTLGYGDILPVEPLARTLAWLEAVAGQIYLTVLVARLVGLHLVQKGKAEGG
jgi:hypothetical protein